MDTTLPLALRFGRYAGEPIFRVVDADRHYSHWLMGQPFFKDRYPDLFSELRRLLAKRLTAEYEDEKAARQRAAAPVAGTERFTLVSAADLCNDLL
jgi:hypothetical protein